VEKGKEASACAYHIISAVAILMSMAIGLIRKTKNLNGEKITTTAAASVTNRDVGTSNILEKRVTRDSCPKMSTIIGYVSSDAPVV